MLCLARPCHDGSCQALPVAARPAMPCLGMPRQAGPCMPCHAMPGCAMPCHAVLCHGMLCHALPCHAMPCHATPGSAGLAGGRVGVNPPLGTSGPLPVSEIIWTGALGTFPGGVPSWPGLVPVFPCWPSRCWVKPSRWQYPTRLVSLAQPALWFQDGQCVEGDPFMAQPCAGFMKELSHSRVFQSFI